MNLYSEIRKEFKFNAINGNVEELAFLSHSLQNNIDFPEEILQKYKSSQSVFPIKWDIPFPSPEDPEFTFIDLFAGIGGFRIPLQELGGKCVFSSENNQYAQQAYELNFGDVPFGDITKVNLDIIPKHNVLCAGFPCQPFSISGKMKGFEDTRGTLIYNVFQIIQEKQPNVVFLENVKNLIHHDEKRTFNTIINHLIGLGYKISYKVLNASDFGIPQNRERIIIIGHKSKEFYFELLKKKEKTKLNKFLDKNSTFEYLKEPFTLIKNPKKQSSGLIFSGYRNKTIRNKGVRPGTEHLSRVHKQPNRIYSAEGVHPALSAGESSGRYWIKSDDKVRKLTIEECYRIMGFPNEFKFIKPKSELYKQIGNSVAIPMIYEIGVQIKKQLL